MREEQSETETEAAEMVEETTSCKQQGHPRFHHTSSHLVRALKFTKSFSRRNKKQVEAAEKKEEKKTVTFAEKIRVQEFEVVDEDGSSKKRRQRRNRGAHDVEPLAILLSYALALAKKYNVSCGLTRKKSRRHRRSRRAHDVDDEPDVSMYEGRDDDQPFTILTCWKVSTS